MAQANAAKWDTWGWLIILDDIAASNRFKQPNLTPMESALDSYFWEAMIWKGKEKHMNVNLAELNKNTPEG